MALLGGAARVDVDGDQRLGLVKVQKVGVKGHGPHAKRAGRVGEGAAAGHDHDLPGTLGGEAAQPCRQQGVVQQAAAEFYDAHGGGVTDVARTETTSAALPACVVAAGWAAAAVADHWQQHVSDSQAPHCLRGLFMPEAWDKDRKSVV